MSAEEIVPTVPKKSGNTRQISPSKHWVFTANNYTKKMIILLCEDSSIQRYSFQEEVGDSGTPHLQGYLEFITKRRPLPRFKWLGAHWEKCKRIKEAIAYTQKHDTRVGKLYLKNIKKLRALQVLKKEQLYPWQRAIVNQIEFLPDDRIINWIWEPEGCAGKSQLCRYLVINHGALMVGGTAADIFYQVANASEAPEIILINLSHNSRPPNLVAIEAVKDGLFASPKYESKMFIMNPPHIFIFGNAEPIFEDDDYKNHTRWKVTKLTSTTLDIYTNRVVV